MVIPDTCVTTCNGTDKIKIWLRFGNIGAAPLSSGVTVKLLLEGEMPAEIPMSIDDAILAPGEYGPAFPIEINVAGVTKITITASPNEAECNVDGSNTITLEPPFCTPPG